MTQHKWVPYSAGPCCIQVHTLRPCVRANGDMRRQGGRALASTVCHFFTSAVSTPPACSSPNSVLAGGWTGAPFRPAAFFSRLAGGLPLGKSARTTPGATHEALIYTPETLVGPRGIHQVRKWLYGLVPLWTHVASQKTWVGLCVKSGGSGVQLLRNITGCSH